MVVFIKYVTRRCGKLLKDGKRGMRYWFTDIGDQPADRVVEVVLSAPANVRIMDKDNFEQYKISDPHKFIGGYVKFTPYKAKLSHEARWYVVVDLGGNPGDVSATVNVYRKGDKKTPITKFPETNN